MICYTVDYSVCVYVIDKVEMQQLMAVRTDLYVYDRARNPLAEIEVATGNRANFIVRGLNSRNFEVKVKSEEGVLITAIF